MKLWIDKQGGFHYHNCKDCEAIKYTVEYQSGYEEIERKVRRTGMPYGKQYGRIKVDGKYYIPCPICIGSRRIYNPTTGSYYTVKPRASGSGEVKDLWKEGSKQ